MVALFQQRGDQRGRVRGGRGFPLARQLQVFRPDLRAGLDDHRHVLDGVLQLAHVAAPVVGAQCADRRIAQFRERRALVAVPDPVRGEEVLREQRDVFRPVAQRGHLDRHHPQPVVEVLPQRARFDGRLGVGVRGGDEPHVHDRVVRLAPDPAHHAVLNDAQQLRLDRLRHLDYLVQEQRAAVRRFEQAGLVADRAGERAFAVTEHLGFEQPLGEGGAVDRYERPTGAATVMVDELRDHLLAAAAFPGDEHRGVGRRHLAGQLDRPAERRRRAKQRDLVAVRVPPLQLLLLLPGLSGDGQGVHRPADQDLEVGGGKRLREIVERALPQRLDARLHAGIPRHHDHDGVVIGGERRAEQRQAVDL